MLKLYYVPRTRSTRPRWMLEELGVPYELHRVDLAAGEHRSAEYLERIQPLGRVPALTDGDVTLFESAAIVMYLADRHPEKALAPPPDSPVRGAYYQWILYTVTELEPHCQTHWNHTVRLPEAERVPEQAARARAAFNANLPPLERALSDGREYLLGDFSAADVVIGWVAGWAFLSQMVDSAPSLQAWSKRCSLRPASKRARAD